jgi:hypothetical protein
LALVVDASVALKWVLEEPDSPAAEALLRIEPDLLIPDFWLWEATNVLWVQVRRKLFTPDEAREALLSTRRRGRRLRNVSTTLIQPGRSSGTTEFRCGEVPIAALFKPADKDGDLCGRGPGCRYPLGRVGIEATATQRGETDCSLASFTP